VNTDRFNASTADTVKANQQARAAAMASHAGAIIADYELNEMRDTENAKNEAHHRAQSERDLITRRPGNNFHAPFTTDEQPSIGGVLRKLSDTIDMMMCTLSKLEISIDGILTPQREQQVPGLQKIDDVSPLLDQAHSVYYTACITLDHLRDIAGRVQL
jgi:hypothetical protein